MTGQRIRFITGSKERAQTLRTILCKTLPGPERVSIHALFGEGCEPNLAADFVPGELVACADVILGVDVDTGSEIPFFGRDLWERTATSGEEVSAKILRVEIDFETDEPDKLAALVKVIKGHHDYHSM